tara:strand:+ start:297 stop:623 length:327 start_codon:yes stop_codon:yes gene_type:complete
MKKSLLIASTILLTTSGFALAGDHPSFSEADTNQDGTLNTQELTAAVPQLELQSATETVTTADIKRVIPEVEFDDSDVVNAAPIGEEQYQQIVDAIDDMEESSSVSSI